MSEKCRLARLRYRKQIGLHDILSRSQRAYRKRLWTCDTLLDLTCASRKTLTGYEARIIQVDCSAAFDLVNHKAALLFFFQNSKT